MFKNRYGSSFRGHHAAHRGHWGGPSEPSSERLFRYLAAAFLAGAALRRARRHGGHGHWGRAPWRGEHDHGPHAHGRWHNAPWRHGEWSHGQSREAVRGLWSEIGPLVWLVRDAFRRGGIDTRQMNEMRTVLRETRQRIAAILGESPAGRGGVTEL